MTGRSALLIALLPLVAGATPAPAPVTQSAPPATSPPATSPPATVEPATPMRVPLTVAAPEADASAQPSRWPAWTALGVSGLALALALALALIGWSRPTRTRDRADADAEDRLARRRRELDQRFERVERDIADLKAQDRPRAEPRWPPRLDAPARTAYAAAATAAQAASPTMASRSLSDALSTLPPGGLAAYGAPMPPASAWAEALAAYQRLVTEPVQERRGDFVQRFAVEPADFVPRLSDDMAALWWVPLRDDGAHGMLVPGYKLIRDWPKSYRGQMGATARAPLEAFYDQSEGDRLRIVEPAIGRLEEDAAITLVTRGRLEGV